jgi:predicted RNA binding protein YcfA (HicA-like mRNA interferase family)
LIGALPKLPGISHLRAQRAFEKAGFRVVRQGKHTTMTDGVRFITIPRHDPVNAYTLGAIITGAGMTIQGFKNLLK